jgi:Holliday junction resolvasome RuvABC endonuclease subunit
VKALGLDIGFASLGWAIADMERDHVRPIALGVLKTKKDPRKVLLSVDNRKRTQVLVRGLREVLGLYPDVGIVCVETIAFVRSNTVMAQIGRANGVVDTICEIHGLGIEEATPAEIKAACCPGVKNASKEDVQRVLMDGYEQVRLQLGKLPKGDREHPADALGALLACQHRDAIRHQRAAFARSRQRELEELVV